MQKKKTTNKKLPKGAPKIRHRHAAILSAALATIHLFAGGLFITPSNGLAPLLPQAQEVVTITNVDREKAGLPDLTADPKLTIAAENKLKDMQVNHYWDHTSPTGTKPWDFIDKSGYTYSYAGENLAKGFATAQSTVDAWMNSTEHRENLLSPHYANIGVAVGTANIGGKESTIIVQMLGHIKEVPTQIGNFFNMTGSVKSATDMGLLTPTTNGKLPYFIAWGILFMLILYDGLKIRKYGLDMSKKHMFEFRAALVVNSFLFALLFINVVSLA